MKEINIMKVQNQIHDCMSFMEFRSVLKEFFALKKSARNNVNYAVHLKKCDEILDKISDSFDDEYENIKRWLCGIRCKYYHPGTGFTAEIPIGNDIEAIYSFLRFIFKLKNHIEIEDEELYELGLQIARSNSPVLWDEC